MKSYKINTTNDILNAVNEKNIDGFLKDFEVWLRMTVEAKKINNSFIKLVGSSFTWNDDNESGVCKSVNIKITEK